MNAAGNNGNPSLSQFRHGKINVWMMVVSQVAVMAGFCAVLPAFMLEI